LVHKYSPDFQALPDSVQSIVKLLTKAVQPERIRLFGSRARGDFRPDSDFDIAVYFDRAKTSEWNRILVELEEKPISLFKIDLVDFESVSPEFKKNIAAEGCDLYVHKAN
jgi:predicted nucleotidyltransferase